MGQTSVEELRANGLERMPVAQPETGGQVAVGQFEQMATALSARARAVVEARFTVAYRKPRQWDTVRAAIMKECDRPSFANDKSAFYKKPGSNAEGLGIRFAEMAARCMTNISVETTTVYEDDQRETVEVTVTDLESNMTWNLAVRITKTVERSKPLDDGSFITWRNNSRGAKTYTVPANDDDLLNKRGALISKAARTLLLRIIPGDIQAEAEERIIKCREDRARQDPDAAKREIVDGFGRVGVKPEALVDMLGHGLDSCSPAELVELRTHYQAIRDGETTIGDIAEAIKAKAAERSKAAADVAARATDRSTKTTDKPKATSKTNVPQAEPKSDAQPADAPKTAAPTLAQVAGAAMPAAVAAAVQDRPAANSTPADAPSGGPTLADALAAVKRGDDDVAADMARALSAEDQAKVSAAMDDRDAGAAPLPGFE